MEFALSYLEETKYPQILSGLSNQFYHTKIAQKLLFTFPYDPTINYEQLYGTIPKSSRSLLSTVSSFDLGRANIVFFKRFQIFLRNWEKYQGPLKVRDFKKYSREEAETVFSGGILRSQDPLVLSLFSQRENFPLRILKEILYGSLEVKSYPFFEKIVLKYRENIEKFEENLIIRIISLNQVQRLIFLRENFDLDQMPLTKLKIENIPSKEILRTLKETFKDLKILPTASQLLNYSRDLGFVLALIEDFKMAPSFLLHHLRPQGNSEILEYLLNTYEINLRTLGSLAEIFFIGKWTPEEQIEALQIFKRAYPNFKVLKNKQSSFRKWSQTYEILSPYAGEVFAFLFFTGVPKDFREFYKGAPEYPGWGLRQTYLLEALNKIYPFKDYEEDLCKYLLKAIRAPRIMAGEKWLLNYWPGYGESLKFLLRTIGPTKNFYRFFRNLPIDFLEETLGDSGEFLETYEDFLSFVRDL